MPKLVAFDLDDTLAPSKSPLPDATRYYRHENGEWREVYAHALSEENRRACAEALESQAKAVGLWEEHTWGPRIEDRGSQVTFSALGQEAPVDAKKAWDPDGSKRERLRARVQAKLPHLDVHSGGSTSIDITKQGIDKVYGIQNLMEHLGLEAADILFVGDRLQPGGNDYPVIATGVQTHAVASWEETAEFVADLLEGL